jgi:ribulose-phosphate 3-epimerase
MSRLELIDQLKRTTPSIFPSMLLCDFANLENEIRQLESAGFHSLHLDVMDGVFVPNITYGMTIVKAVNSVTNLIVDVHLMMVQPEKYFQLFKEAGADVLTLHAEATDDLSGALKQLREMDIVAGVAINPGTPVSQIADSLEYADLVLPMSVEPGFGGQSFNEDVLPKFKEIKELAPHVLLQIDGGINSKTISTARAAGVELFVVGSAIFKTEDYSKTRQELRNLMGAVNERA